MYLGVDIPREYTIHFTSSPVLGLKVFAHGYTGRHTYKPNEVFNFNTHRIYVQIVYESYLIVPTLKLLD